MRERGGVDDGGCSGGELCREGIAAAGWGGNEVSGADAELREYLREWRRTTAKEQGVPAFVVLHDTTLEEICRRRPSSIADLMNITGIGERKAEVYGRGILAALERYREGARASAVLSSEKMTAPALGDHAFAGGWAQFRGHCENPWTADVDRGECCGESGGTGRLGVSAGLD